MWLNINWYDTGGIYIACQILQSWKVVEVRYPLEYTSLLQLGLGKKLQAVYSKCQKQFNRKSVNVIKSYVRCKIICVNCTSMLNTKFTLKLPALFCSKCFKDTTIAHVSVLKIVYYTTTTIKTKDSINDKRLSG